MNKLNLEQKKAVEHISGPLIIIAGAGTGKTSVIAEKIKYILDNKLANSREILALTFNEKAASEMQNRVDELVDIGYSEINIHTFHAFCQRLLDDYAIDIGLPTKFKILTASDAWLLVRKNLDKFDLDYYRPIGNPTKNIHELIRHFSKCKDEMITPENYLEFAENSKLNNDNAQIEERNRLTEISKTYHAYNRLLLDNSCLDFGDLIYYTNILLEKRPAILHQLQKQFKFILVDEFQDVNWAQYELIKKLSNKQTQLTVVGDDDQSIYAFRGASVSNILKFKDDFSNAEKIVLTKNYRSGQNILDNAYELIKNNNPDRLEVKLNIDKKLESQIKTKGVVCHVHSQNIDGEARFVVDEIIKIKKENTNCVWDDFAVLIRANSQAEPFMEQFEKMGVPYEFLASSGLYRQPIILDCYNFFKVIDDYKESSAVYRLMNMPFVEMPDDDIFKITHFADKEKTISYFESLKRNAEIELSLTGREKAEKILTLINEGIIAKKNSKPTQILYKFLESSGYLNFLLKGESANNRSIVRSIHYLTQFFDYIANYEKMTPDASVGDFMDHFKQIIDSGDLGIIKQPEDTPDSVNILTIHTAKGLEYKYVFVVNLVEDRFPSRRKKEPIELPFELIKEQLPEGDSHEQEERRLFYVAITRAKERLYLTSAFDYGGTRVKKISRFLSEIGFKPSDTMQNEKNALLQTKQTPETQNNLTHYQIPKIFSFSDIQTYNNCPYKYKLSKILKLPSASSPSMTFGSVMHKTLEELYKMIFELNSVRQNSLFENINLSNRTSEQIITPTLDKLIEIYNKCWRDDSYISERQKDDYYEKGKLILREFYNYNSQTGWTMPLSLEINFSIKINGHTLMGRMDRVEKTESGNLEIIDYKTGEAKDKLDAEDKEQLLIYQIAANNLEQFKKIGKCEKLTYYYLNSNSKLSFIGEEENIEKIKIKITDTVDKIQRHEFSPKPEKYSCARCGFRDICDYRA